MAARKSCTHLTWAEAKSKVGGDSSGTGIKKKKGEKPKKLNHVEKIIAKNAGTTPDKIAQERAAMKRDKRLEEKLAAVAAQRALARQEMNQIGKIKPAEESKRRMAEAAFKMQALQELSESTVKAMSIDTSNMDMSVLQNICQCRSMQLDEIMALEAIFADSDDLLISYFSRVEELREKVETYQNDEESETNAKVVVNHPPLQLLLQLTISGGGQALLAEEGLSELELVASVLLKVTLPPTYPLMIEESEDETSLPKACPKFEVPYFFCADTQQEVNADKPLESLANLDERNLTEALQEQAALQTLPDFCVYEVGVTWLSEHLFEFVSLNKSHELIRRS